MPRPATVAGREGEGVASPDQLIPPEEDSRAGISRKTLLSPTHHATHSGGDSQPRLIRARPSRFGCTGEAGRWRRAGDSNSNRVPPDLPGINWLRLLDASPSDASDRMALNPPIGLFPQRICDCCAGLKQIKGAAAQ